MNSDKNVTPHSPDPATIKSMFSKVAANYDRANSVLSIGIHHLWRKKVIRISRVQPGMKILDCATGTGDLAIAFKKAVGSSGSVIGTDFCLEMMETAPAKAKIDNLEIKFEFADVMQLQYPDQQFDITSISFGIRNVGDPLRALEEMARVTKSKGQVIILEFGKMEMPVVSRVYNYYAENILPKLGGIVSGQKEAYEYLQKSSAAFPSREKFLDLMRKTDRFSKVNFTPVSFGIAYIYVGHVK